MDSTLPHVAAQLSEHRLTSTWAVRPEALDVIAARLTAGPDALAPAAARTADVPTTGGVAVITLRGLMTARPSMLGYLFGGSGGSLALFRSCLREAVGSEEIGSIVLDIDSPGGSTDLVAETAEEIRSLRGTKPIIALANTQAASGAYWLASAADEVVITPSGRVGSIGVFIIHLDESGLEERIGLKSTYVSAGKYKVEGNPSEPLDDDAREHLEEIVGDYYDLFTAGVAKGRGVRQSAVKSGFGEGRVVTANRAVELGMADRVDSFESVVSKLAGRKSNGRRAKATSMRVTLDEGLLPSATSHEEQPEDKPTPKAEEAEEETARIARLATAQPHHL